VTSIAKTEVAPLEKQFAKIARFRFEHEIREENQNKYSRTIYLTFELYIYNNEIARDKRQQQQSNCDNP
jgi:hypothetical protein